MSSLAAALSDRVFRPAGGLWNLVVGAPDDAASQQLPARLIDETIRWMSATLPPADAASCFLDRHRDDPMARISAARAREYVDHLLASLHLQEKAA